ncbi:MAG: zinc-dependent alcohol dehydrogenase family protein [Verrucomicrobiae bacterium]|nr:zinc-dependent alcohol dehydrogenase family protein [Verrucomicrobiae bacterium]
MKAMLLRAPAAVETAPLQPADLPAPEPQPGEILLRIRACGICHTDLHVVEGEIQARLPIIPGHQIVGVDEATGRRVGVPWLYRSCGACAYCRGGRENLCEHARFTGFHVNGGFAEYVVAPADFVVPIPNRFADADAAPLLCAGIIGYRALRLALKDHVPAWPPSKTDAAGGGLPRVRLGLYGFGASAHIAIQIARHWGCEVFVATRAADHQRLARDFGAGWVGVAGDVPSNCLDAAIIFAPSGALVPEALRALRKGGTVALAGIYMTPIPELAYERIYHERVLRSVANATREDAGQLMRLAAEIPVRTEVEIFPLVDANRALLALKRSELRAAAVLVP